MDFKIKVAPFSWNDNLADEAQETLGVLREKLDYASYISIGMALAKLEKLEKQGAKVDSSISL